MKLKNKHSMGTKGINIMSGILCAGMLAAIAVCVWWLVGVFTTKDYASAAETGVTINNVQPDSANLANTDYVVLIQDSGGNTVHTVSFNTGTDSSSTVNLDTDESYKLLVQIPSGYEAFVTVGGQTYYAKLLNLNVTSGMTISIEGRLRSQGWFDDVTFY